MIPNHKRDCFSSAQAVTGLIVHVLGLNAGEDNSTDDEEPRPRNGLERVAQQFGSGRDLGCSGCVRKKAAGIDEVPRYTAVIGTSKIVVPPTQKYQC